MEYCAIGFSSGGSKTRTLSSRTWTTRRSPLADSFGCGVAVTEPSPAHDGESLIDESCGSSLLLNGLTRTNIYQRRKLLGATCNLN